jgi:hypothetical protein
MRKTLLLLVPVLLSACTYGITLDDAAKNVRTAWGGDVSGCRDMGKVTVSVQDHIGPVDRNNITVRDELEVLARNQAAELHADTIKPLADPTDGSQPWGSIRKRIRRRRRATPLRRPVTRRPFRSTAAEALGRIAMGRRCSEPRRCGLRERR